MDLVRSRRKTQSDPLCAAFHVINPRTTDWQSLLPAITNYFDVECVSLLAWTDELKKIAGPTAEDLEEKPALKILSTLEALASIDKPRSWIETTKTEAASENLRQMAAIDSLQMENWLKQWNF